MQIYEIAARIMMFITRGLNSKLSLVETISEDLGEFHSLESNDDFREKIFIEIVTFMNNLH